MEKLPRGAGVRIWALFLTLVVDRGICPEEHPPTHIAPLKAARTAPWCVPGQAPEGCNESFTFLSPASTLIQDDVQLAGAVEAKDLVTITLPKVRIFELISEFHF